VAGETGSLPAYLVVKIVGQGNFEKRVNELVAQGYEPVGGVWVMTVQHPITGQENLGFLQPMFRRSPNLRLLS
jgi:hypothetical protein